MVVFNDGLVNVVKNYLKKGSKVYVEGALQTRKWTNKEGQEQYSTEVVLQGFGGTLTMLDGPRSGGEGASSSYSAPSYSNSAPSQNKAELLDDEIPF